MPRPTTLPEPWRSLAAKLGGVQALADALHSDARTVRRWSIGERIPRGPARALIISTFRNAGIQAPY